MDVQANPGPVFDPNYDRLAANYSRNPSTNGAPRCHYTPDQLISPRPSSFPTKYLTPQLTRRLKDLEILKYRGKTVGSRANMEANRIPVIQERRTVTKFNSNRRVNLHNLRPLKRCLNNNIDPSITSEVCTTERSTIQATGGSESGLKILHLNIRSLRNISHLSQLIELNNCEQFDIITISESWLNTAITSTEIKLDGYRLFCLDRLHKRGGGVCAYVRSELKSKVLKDLTSIRRESRENPDRFTDNRAPKAQECRGGGPGACSPWKCFQF